MSLVFTMRLLMYYLTFKMISSLPPILSLSFCSFNLLDLCWGQLGYEPQAFLEGQTTYQGCLVHGVSYCWALYYPWLCPWSLYSSFLLISSQLLPHLLSTPSSGPRAYCQHSVPVHHLHVPSHWASFCSLISSWYCLWTQAILPLYLAQQILTSCCSNTQRINMVLFGLFTAKGTFYLRWPQACPSAPPKTIVPWQSPLPHHASCWVLWAAALGGACPALLDRDAFWGIVSQPVAMGHHMRSGAQVCIPVVVSIELEGWEWIKGITGMKTCSLSDCTLCAFLDPLPYLDALALCGTLCMFIIT